MMDKQITGTTIMNKYTSNDNNESNKKYYESVRYRECSQVNITCYVPQYHSLSRSLDGAWEAVCSGHGDVPTGLASP